MENEISNAELKKIIEIAYETADEIDKTPLGELIHENGLKCSLRSALKLDLIRFISFLASINGRGAERESFFLRYYFDLPSGTREVQGITDVLFSGVNYSQELPGTFQLYLSFDKYAPRMGLNIEGKFNFSASYIMLYVYLGRKFVRYYGTVDSDEGNAMIQFINKLDHAREEQLANVSHENEETTETVDSDTLESLLIQLDELIGMENVKQDVHSLINLMRIQEIKKQRGLPRNDLSLHMVFMGNPGTGKTTVARLIAKIYQKIGVLSRGHLVEVDRSGLVAGYVGQTALKVQEKIAEARGGILFIDEAYALTAGRDSSDFGFEAVDTLIKGMEDYRDDFMVIVAGYPKPMLNFLESNPGFKSRFNKFINFEDYSPDELFSIFNGMCKKSGFKVSDTACQIVHQYFTHIYEKRESNFANGRDVRNFFEKVVVHQANRLAEYDVLTDEDLIMLDENDFLCAINR